MQQVKQGDTVKVHYHGRLTDGTIFDSSEGRQPLEFQVGSGMVIKGFDESVQGMSVGEKKTVSIPVMMLTAQDNRKWLYRLNAKIFRRILSPKLE